jgi:hypothetical protein
VGCITIPFEKGKDFIHVGAIYSTSGLKIEFKITAKVINRL